jgi:hypothetical protein
MKCISLLFFILPSFFNYCIAQTSVYPPLPDSGYYWHVIDIDVEMESGMGDTIQASFL